MLNVIVTDPPRADLRQVDKLAEYGVATVHEAIGRNGHLGPGIRPNQQGTRIAGTALSVLCWPGENLMIHAAVELVQPGDVLVVTTTAESTDGMFGELLASSLRARGCAGLIIDAGVRDVADLTTMEFPVWSKAISAMGTVKATAGSVNIPVVCAGEIVNPGDVIVADVDGVCVVRRAEAAAVAQASDQRRIKEENNRVRLKAGDLGLDMYGLRDKLKALGVEWKDEAPGN